MRFSSQALRAPLDLLYYETLGKILHRDHVLIACMPKSGSTFLSNAVSRLPGFRKATLVRMYGRSEQELAIEQALRKHRYNYVAQHHVKYNENTQFVMYKFDLKPIVLVRNIFDCIVSVRDHFRNESVLSPTAWINEQARDRDDAELERMIAYLVIPWYIHFYVSWMQCPGTLLVTYEDMTRDTAGTLEKICTHLDLNFGREAIGQALSEQGASTDRRNVGISGRGQALSDEIGTLMRRYRTFYPEIDFTPIGLD